jgi:hypothetical protein
MLLLVLVPVELPMPAGVAAVLGAVLHVVGHAQQWLYAQPQHFVSVVVQPVFDAWHDDCGLQSAVVLKQGAVVVLDPESVVV